MEPTTGYVKERVRALLPNMGDKFSVTELAQIAYDSVIAECEDAKRLHLMLNDLVMESCVAGAKSVVSSGTSRGSKNMTKNISETLYVFSDDDLENTFIKTGGGSVIRFGAAKWEDLERFRIRKKENRDKIIQDYDSYCHALEIVKPPMIQNNWSMGKYLRENGRVFAAKAA